MIPARELLWHDLKDHALGHEVLRHRRHACLAGLTSTNRLHHLIYCVAVLDDLAFAANHYAPQLGVRFAALGHHRDFWIAPDIQYLLRLPVAAHVNRAVARDVIHSDQVRISVLADGAERDLAGVAQESFL